METEINYAVDGAVMSAIAPDSLWRRYLVIVAAGAVVTATAGPHELRELSAADALVLVLAATVAAAAQTATAKVSHRRERRHSTLGQCRPRHHWHHSHRCHRFRPNAAGRAAASAPPRPQSPPQVCVMLKQHRQRPQHLHRRRPHRQQTDTRAEAGGTFASQPRPLVAPLPRRWLPAQLRPPLACLRPVRPLRPVLCAAAGAAHGSTH